MSRWTAWTVHLSALLAGGTGLVYAWMRYLLEPADEFSLVHHPWEPATRDLHLLVVPVLLFACGLIWRAHVWARLRSGFPKRRKTGWALVALLLPMAASGYLLQISVEPLWRAVWTWTHGLTGVVWTLAYVVHPWTRRRARRRAVEGARPTAAAPDPSEPSATAPAAGPR